MSAPLLLKKIKLLFAIVPIILIVSLCLSLGRIQAQNVGINSTGIAPDVSSMLDISSNTRGTLITRMSTAQRDSIGIICSCTPAEGLQVFNTTSHCLEFFVGGIWQTIACGCAGPPASPTATSDTGVGLNRFTANWNKVTGATGYLLDVSTAGDFSSFVSGDSNLNVGNVLSYTVTGLTATTTYYYRVRAVNNCGISSNSNTVDTTTVVNFPITGLVSYWKFDESSGDDAHDAVGTNNLTNWNNTAFSAGIIGNAADFGNVENHGYAFYQAGQAGFGVNLATGAFSISFWFMSNSVPSSGVGRVVDWNSTTGGIGTLTLEYLDDAGTIKLRGFLSSGGTPVFSYPIILTTGIWYHIVITCNSSGNANLYLNGSPVQITTRLTLGGAGANSVFGNDNALHNNGAACKIDETGIWSRELSAGEVLTLYNSANGLAYPF